MWLNWGSLGMVFMPLFAAAFFTYDWQAAWWNWRVFDSGAPGVIKGAANHHTLIMVTLGVTGTVLLLRGVKPVLAFIGVFFASQVHEVYWWVFFIVSRLSTGGPLEAWWFQVSVGSIAPIVVWGVAVRRVPWKFLAWEAAFYVAWLAFGFPVSVDFQGNVPGLYAEFWTNAFWEIGGWVYTMAGFVLFAAAPLEAMSNKLQDWVKVN